MAKRSFWQGLAACFTSLMDNSDQGIGCGRRLRLESLEDRRLLAITWTNQGTANSDTDNFAAIYGTVAAPIAREIVNRAIDDWEAVITDFNYDGDNNPVTNNTYSLSVVAASISGRGSSSTTFTSGLPTQGSVTLDDNGGGIGWFFDSTPLDDAEFTAVANSGSAGTGTSFQASFVDVQGGLADFYRTIVHEIGHTMGLASSSPVFALTNNPLMTFIGADPLAGGGSLYSFHDASGQFGVTATFTTNGGRHLYEGSHPNDLMNPGRITPVGNPVETTRQFITDLNVQLLADAYGYTVTLPSTFNTAHATLDSQTGTLLVQGRTNSLNDTINVDVVGSNIRVQVNGTTTELVPQANVTQIIIAGNGGTDTVTVAPALAPLRKDVQYVVSSNQDSADAGTLGDSIVDLDPLVPGRQVALRAAIVDANGTAGAAARAIYVPRGQYNLTLTGTESSSTKDLDVTGNMNVFGAGAGASIINASTLNLPTSDADNRAFHVTAAATLGLSRVTVEGANGNYGGAALVYGNLNVSQSALVNNTVTGGAGPAIRFVGSTGKSISITSSVFTNNEKIGGSGGAIYASGGGTITVGNSIFALNTGGSFPNIYATGTTVTSLGGNLTDNNSGSFFNHPTDKTNIGTPNYVVTSVVDTFNHADDDYALSLREAIDLANGGLDPSKDNLLEEIWLPAWTFVLTRDRATFGSGTTDTDIAFGDLDISDKLRVRGVSTSLTKVTWRPGVVDAVFDLLGDYNGNGLAGPLADDGTVNNTDYSKWIQQYGDHNGTGSNQSSADGDDDGDVDGADYLIWQQNYGNTLQLIDLSAILV